MTSMWRPRYFAVVSRHEKVPTAPHMSAMPMSRARRALAASRASRADSVFMDVAASCGDFSVGVACGPMRVAAVARVERQPEWRCHRAVADFAVLDPGHAASLAAKIVGRAVQASCRRK